MAQCRGGQAAPLAAGVPAGGVPPSALSGQAAAGGRHAAAVRGPLQLLALPPQPSFPRSRACAHALPGRAAAGGRLAAAVREPLTRTLNISFSPPPTLSPPLPNPPQVACLRVRSPREPPPVGDSLLQFAGPVIGRITGVITREELTGNPELGNDLLEVTLFRYK